MSDAPAPSASELAGGALGPNVGLGGVAFERLVAVIARLRRDCPWDAEQTHLTLVKHLVEEAGETVDAIEAGSITDLKEELGDLLIQVCFHAEIARTDAQFTIDDVIVGVTNKLISRHPYVFGDDETPDDMMASWEAGKRAEKQRDSALEGIPEAMNAVARAAKVVTRVRDVHLDVPLEDASITADETGQALLSLIERAQASGVDPDQALRASLRTLEAQVRAAEH
ncbi:MAG: MazG family protein [Propionibacteriaceae bacterium]|jgi:XTP/dITP diphosphohydrolase|nr:MazG family protein [Propionibacteriaceae bacterium]